MIATAHIDTRRLCVSKLLSVLSSGASIFTGKDERGNAVRVVASPKALGRVPALGETWLVTGSVKHDDRHGMQLHAQSGRYELPRGRLLVTYLAKHRDLKAIGETKAERLWETFGERLYAVLSEGPVEALHSVLSDTAAQRLAAVWAEKRGEAETIEFLDAHGFDWHLASKLTRVWGARTLDMLKRNPYHLLAFMSWSRVDAAARKLGVAPDDDRRLVGAVEACLYDRLLAGRHTATSPAKLKELLARLIPKAEVERALKLAIDESAACLSDDGRVQSFGAWSLEHGIARRIRQMLVGEQAMEMALFPLDVSEGWAEATIREVDAEQGFPLNAEQRLGVVLPFENQFSVLTGGAGVGKTTVLRTVLRLAEQQSLPVLQMALAGRAAQRMAEATGHPAMTIAKFIAAARRGSLDVPASCMVVVDEASMLDLPTLYRILMYLPDGVRLMLVGDPAQLPPIAFGLVFHRLVDSDTVPKVHLTQVQRQKWSSGIPHAADLVRKHKLPEFVPFEGKHAGVSFIDCSPDQAMPLLRRIAREWNGDDWQALAAVNGGRSGIRHVNASFHADAAGGHVQDVLLVGEPVVHLVNDYERSLMNGTLGRVVSVEDGGGLSVNFDGDIHTFDAADVPGRLELAYALSVHKAQGSQFGRVVVLISRSRVLDHSLVYTALTRGVDQVVFVGDRRAFEEAIKSAPAAQRREVAFWPEVCR